jgi:hypothetical protein
MEECNKFCYQYITAPVFTLIHVTTGFKTDIVLIDNELKIALCSHIATLRRWNDYWIACWRSECHARKNGRQVRKSDSQDKEELREVSGPSKCPTRTGVMQIKTENLKEVRTGQENQKEN